ncbi:hypothetical protein CSB09_00605 [Candidatus Gracilibacteria bacterium]|nr:MAG: hypothetical protein CSB09_00605 [Candidatus Gracilibacteria bacterium]
MEKFLLKHMGKVLTGIGTAIFLFWLIPKFNLPTWEIFNILFGIKELKSPISTQYMFISIGTIFAFWYGYKKYERDKELEFMNMNLGIFDNSTHEQIIDKWRDLYYFYSNGYMSKELFERKEQDYIHYIEKYILNSDDFNLLQLELTKILFNVQSNGYFLDICRNIKCAFEKNKANIPEDKKKEVIKASVFDYPITWEFFDYQYTHTIQCLNNVIVEFEKSNQKKL